MKHVVCLSMVFFIFIAFRPFICLGMRVTPEKMISSEQKNAQEKRNKNFFIDKNDLKKETSQNDSDKLNKKQIVLESNSDKNDTDSQGHSPKR